MKAKIVKQHFVVDIAKCDTADLFGRLLTNFNHVRAQCCTGMASFTTSLASCH
jgi:hypothetical protein